MASEAAKEAIDAQKKIEQDETDVQQRKIEDLAKENEEADKKQFEYEKQRAMKKKEAEEKMRRQEEHMRRTEHDFKKAAYEEASHQQSKAAARAEEQAKYANLLDQKVTQLKAKVEDLKTDNTKAQEKLKTERSALLDTNAKRKAAKLKYDEAESRYNAERKIVDETRANAEDSADDLAKLRIALLKAEDQRDSTKDKAQHAQEEKVFADKQAMERKRELESHNSTNATMLDESLMVEML